jgi:hypothetical protein
MKEEELMKKHSSHKKYTDLEISMKKQQTITTKLIMEFDNLAYVSGPLS